MPQTIFLTGDWLKADRVFTGLSLRLLGARDAAGHALADAAARRARANIFAQRYPHTPLSPMTVAFKAKASLDPRILIATGKMVRAIKAISLGGGRWGIGTDDPEIATRMEVNEFGGVSSTGRVIPPRPFLSVELERMRQTARPTIAAAFAIAFEGGKYATGYLERQAPDPWDVPDDGGE